MLNYLARVWDYRYFWMALVHNDVHSRYRGSVLGIGWSLMQPLGMTVILCLVFSGMFNMEISFFAPFLLSGFCFWAFFTHCASGGTMSILSNEGYIRQFPAPLAVYSLRTTLAGGVHALFSLLATFLATVYLLGCPGVLPLLSLLPTLLLLTLFGWGVATLFGLATVYFRDTRHLTEVGLQGLFYLTPILFPPEKFEARSKFIAVLTANPLTPLLDLIRQPLLYNTVPSVNLYLTATAVVATTVFLAALSLARLERRVIFQL